MGVVNKRLYYRILKTLVHRRLGHGSRKRIGVCASHINSFARKPDYVVLVNIKVSKHGSETGIRIVSRLVRYVDGYDVSWLRSGSRSSKLRSN
jgi:hypothetical protein